MSMNARKLTCIICPRGCELEFESDGNKAVVRGNGCPKGKQYAVDECTDPRRTVTSTVRVENRHNTMVSVKTDKPIKKSEIFEAMKLIRSKTVKAPVHIGDVIISDVFGADIVATKNID